MQDFCRCTPSEFRAIFDAWSGERERRERGEWERVRMSCLCALQPYSKKKLKASDIMEFPWEKKEVDAPASGSLTAEELNERYAMARRMYGLFRAPAE